MDKSALVETLILSEKNHSIVKIKMVNLEKPIVGAVQKVLNQLIILKPSAAEPITLTFGDIESVNDSQHTFLSHLREIFSKILHQQKR